MAPIKKNDDRNNKSNYQPIQRLFSPTKKPLKVENKKTKVRNQNSTWSSYLANKQAPNVRWILQTYQRSDWREIKLINI